MEASPSDSVMKKDAEEHVQTADWDLESPPVKNRSGVLNTFVAGLALFSDGYNAQISKCHGKSLYSLPCKRLRFGLVGYMEALFSVL